MRLLKTLLMATGALAGPLLATSAMAQSPAQSEAQPTPSDEVIVTAQKRSESVQRVPASITALSTEMLEQRGITQTEDLKFVVPNMQVGTLIGNTAINIRGVGLGLVATSASPGVAVHVDGVYQPVTAMGDLAQADLERVEVLRGPQGTLYGRNANAGAVNFITKAPTDGFEGYVQVGYASYDETRLRGVFNAPINERVRARGVVDWRDQREGFVENVLPGGQDVVKNNTLSGRLRIAADLTDTLKLDINLSHLHSTGPQTQYVLRNLPSPTAVAANPFLGNTIVPLQPWRTAVNDPVDHNRDFSFAAATLTWDVGDLQVKSISGYQRLKDDIYADEDGTNVAGFQNHRVYHDEAFTQELNVSGSFGPVDALAGVFYMDEIYDSFIYYRFPNGIAPLPANSQQGLGQPKLNTEAMAAFADATYNVTDRFRVLGGMRVSKDTLTVTQQNFLSFGNAPIIFNCPLQTHEIEFDSTTGRAGAQFDLTNSSNIYTTVSQGFKDGGYNRTQCNQTYQPEQVTAYEIGIKNRLFDNTVTLNASAFYYDYTDLQLQQQIGLGQRIINAPGAEIKGVEIEGVWTPNDHWTINGNLSFLDATYTRLLNDDGLIPGLLVEDLSGNTLNNAPKETANLGVTYRTGMMSTGELTFRADASQRTKAYFREFNRPLDAQEGHTLLNLAMIWDSPDSKYRIRFYGNNVTNEAVITSLSTAEAFGARYGTWNTPRQIGVELRANF